MGVVIAPASQMPVCPSIAYRAIVLLADVNANLEDVDPSPLCSVLYLAECSKAWNLEFTSPWRTELAQRALAFIS
ncbi:hypothetical protein SBA3_3290016 [Candidatus Sulfopaludibacter sp. SbA3]|nr:hypothetical protein SBA3_3290016 [Candidatus Sulfopaludibacter sp. SbA3]